MRIAVYIATTAGPIRIERIVGEQVPQSNVFVGRDYKPLEPLSSDYQAFVAPGGPVEIAFGPFESKSFRLDISGPISTGNSWELAIFVAHGLAQSGQLAGPDDHFDSAMLLSGRVDADLGIGAVGHIDEKANAATELITGCKSRSCPITLFLPSVDAISQSASRNISVRAVANAMDILAYVGKEHEKAPTSSYAAAILKEKTPNGTLRSVWLWLIIVLLFGTGGYAIIDRSDTFRDASFELADVRANVKSTTASNQPLIKVFELHPPKGKSCIDVHFGDIPAQEVQVAITASSKITSSYLAEICALRVVIESTDSEFKGAAKLDVLSGRFMGQDIPKEETLFEGRKEWVLNLPSRMENTLKILISARPGSGEGETVKIEHQVVK